MHECHSKMILQMHFNTDFARIYHLSTLALEPRTMYATSSIHQVASFVSYITEITLIFKRRRLPTRQKYLHSSIRTYDLLTRYIDLGCQPPLQDVSVYQANNL